MSNPEDAVMPFGKYAGKTLGDILAADPQYLLWLSEEAEIRSHSLREAVEQMVDKYDHEINPD